VLAARAAGARHVGLVVNLEPKYPASESAADLAATRRADAYMNRQYLDPVFHGRYPAELAEMYGEAWPDFAASDLHVIRSPLDFLGINYYTRSVTREAPEVPLLRAAPVPQAERIITATGWEVFPDALTRTLDWVKREYGDLPLYVTENGAAFYDAPFAIDGRVDDPLRVAYYRWHLEAVHAAVEHGVDVRGYFAWSLLDNFEWSLGYAKRFGLIHVNFATQERTLKASAHLYREVIRTRGRCLAQ
jgi:beta-glucosidase